MNPHVSTCLHPPVPPTTAWPRARFGNDANGGRAGHLSLAFKQYPAETR